MGELWRISAPHFVAGLVLAPPRGVRRAAPIIKYMIGWNYRAIDAYCEKKRWQLEFVAWTPVEATT